MSCGIAREETVEPELPKSLVSSLAEAKDRDHVTALEPEETLDETSDQGEWEVATAVGNPRLLGRIIIILDFACSTPLGLLSG